VFKTARVPGLLQGTFYVCRVAGEPGESLRLAYGKLYVNGAPVALTNASGEIRYVNFSSRLGGKFLTSSQDTLTVPDGYYFVLGDNSTNSLDGRVWGFLPATNIAGRASFCFWPPRHFGTIR